MTDIDLLCPIEPHEIDKKQRFLWNDLLRRVTAKACVQGRGQDLLLYIYLAGLYHGAKAQAAKSEPAT